MADNDGRIWVASAFSRALVDEDVAIDSPNHGPFLRSHETIKLMHGEQIRLSKMLNTAYLLTAVLAILILYTTPGAAGKIGYLGIETSIAALPQQALAVFMAGIFGMYATYFVSYILLSQLISKVLTRERPDTWIFLSAPFDASTLWTVILSPRTIGYRSPKRLVFASAGVVLVAGGTVIAHSIVVEIAAIHAARAAWIADNWGARILGTGSVVIVSASIASVLLLMLWKVPFRWPDDVPLPSDDRN